MALDSYREKIYENPNINSEVLENKMIQEKRISIKQNIEEKQINTI